MGSTRHNRERRGENRARFVIVCYKCKFTIAIFDQRFLFWCMQTRRLVVCLCSFLPYAPSFFFLGAIVFAFPAATRFARVDFAAAVAALAYHPMRKILSRASASHRLGGQAACAAILASKQAKRALWRNSSSPLRWQQEERLGPKGHRRRALLHPPKNT